MSQPRVLTRVRPTGRDVRLLLLGRGVDGLLITRQAYRVRPLDTDEVITIAAGRDHWVASRVGDRIAIWACPDAEGADDKFETLTAPCDGWVHASHDATRAGQPSAP